MKLGLIESLIRIYILLVVIDAIFSYFPNLQSKEWIRNLRKVANYSCDPVRKIIPKPLPYDFAPLVVIVILQLIIILF